MQYLIKVYWQTCNKILEKIDWNKTNVEKDCDYEYFVDTLLAVRVKEII